MLVAGSSYRLHETTILECCSSNQKLQVWFSDNFQDTSLAQVIKMEGQTTQRTRSARTTRTLFIKPRSSQQTSPFIQLKRRRIINLLRQQQQHQLMLRLTTIRLLHWLKRQLQQFSHMPEQIAILTRCYHSMLHQIRSKIHNHCALPTLVSIWQRRLRKPRRLSTRANCRSICILRASKVQSITKEVQHRYWSRHRLN